ncbi:MAG: porin family protein [Gammaproteobacteria bacterium]|nr:porin family protein [Gammaproteobacteria bacterium]MDH5693419.1 porin family protein [Gammaproteobacteria bacterium]
MKNKLLGCGLAMAMASGTAMAAPPPVDYWGAGLGFLQVTNLDNGMSLVANAGKAMPDIHKNFSVEGEFTYSLSPASKGDSILKIESSLMSLGGYGVYTHEINRELSVRGRAGLNYNSAENKTTGSACGLAFVICPSGSESKIELGFGVGASYQVNKGMAATFNYTKMNSDSTMIAFGVKMDM